MTRDEHSVTLTVYSGSLVAAELVARIGMDPDEHWDRGDALPSGRTRTCSAVRYTSELPREVRATEQVSALLGRLSPRARDIGALSETAETEVTLSVGYFVNEPQWQDRDEGFLVRGLGVVLDSAEVSTLSAMGARLDIEFYVSRDEPA